MWAFTARLKPRPFKEAAYAPPMKASSGIAELVGRCIHLECIAEENYVGGRIDV